MRDIFLLLFYCVDAKILISALLTGSSHLADDPISAGLPSFVVQEEFDRYTGYWWQPRFTHDPGNSHFFCLQLTRVLVWHFCGDFLQTLNLFQGDPAIYRILYEEVDESDVDILHIVSPNNEDKGFDEYRYPRAGEFHLFLF